MSEPMPAVPGALPHLIIHPGARLLAQAAAARMLVKLIDGQSDHSPQHVAITGGTIGIDTLAAVAASPLRAAVDWSQVHIWWSDERFLPAGHPDRNETQARQALFDELSIPESVLHPVPSADQVATCADAAEAYAGQLAQWSDQGSPIFDLTLLGVGPEGHVASLFPDREELSITDRVTTAVLDSPKPPPQRVSFTLPTLRGSKELWILASGRGKADVVRAVWQPGGAVLPAGLVRGQQSTLWLVDLEASAWLDPMAATAGN